MRVLWIALSLATIAAPYAAYAQESISSSERLSASPRQIERQIERDLLSVFEPRRTFPRGNLRGVHDVAVYTKPYRTDISGLCRRDQLLIFYAPTRAFNDDEVIENVPVRPYRVESRAQFQWLHTADPAMLMPNGDDDRYTPPWSGECTNAFVDSDGDGWEPGWYTIEGNDEHLAVRAMLTLPPAVAAVRSGRIHVDKCEELSSRDVGAASCAERLADAASSPFLAHIGRCSPHIAVNICYAYDISSTIINVEYLITVRGVPTAADIVAVSAEEYIIVT